MTIIRVLPSSARESISGESSHHWVSDNEDNLQPKFLVHEDDYPPTDAMNPSCVASVIHYFHFQEFPYLNRFEGALSTTKTNFIFQSPWRKLCLRYVWRTYPRLLANKIAYLILLNLLILYNFDAFNCSILVCLKKVLFFKFRS